MTNLVRITFHLFSYNLVLRMLLKSLLFLSLAASILYLTGWYNYILSLVTTCDVFGVSVTEITMGGTNDSITVTNITSNIDQFNMGEDDIIRWPANGVRCPRCAENGVETIVLPGRHCPRCGQQC